MSPEEIRSILPDHPVDGHIVEYWRVDSADLKRPVRVICRFDVSTSWKEHPWGKGGSSGADFENDWSIWVEYYPGSANPEGRVVGWSALRSNYLSSIHSYHSEELANQALINLKKGTIAALKLRAEVLQADIDRIAARSAT